jgi:hypothetical protein
VGNYSKDGWSYVAFPPFNSMSGWMDQADAIDSFRRWLEEWCSPEGVGWFWRRGDRFAEGVYIQDPSIAVMFKLKFDV